MTIYEVHPGGYRYAKKSEATKKARAIVRREGGSAYVTDTNTGKLVAEYAHGGMFAYGRAKVKRVNSGRSTKKQRKAAAQRRAVVRRKAKAAAGMLKAMNPASKVRAVRVKRLKGGGVSIIPVKVKVLRRGR